MSEKLENGQVILTLSEALERLPDTPEIHTFMEGPGPGRGILLVGASWDREKVIALLAEAAGQEDKKRQIQETGDVAQGMGHGICVPYSKSGPVFIEARGPDKYSTLFQGGKK